MPGFGGDGAAAGLFDPWRRSSVTIGVIMC